MNLRIRSFLLILFMVPINLFPQNISDLIQPVKLVAGETDSILISDLFYADDYDIQIISSQNIDSKFVSEILILTPSSSFEGMELLSFSLKGKQYHLPVIVEAAQKVTFSYKPENPISKINLFGSFNNWDRSNFLMTDENSDGIYEISIPLEPGRYEYKYFVDSAEIIDSMNPEQHPNGFGGFNSVLTVFEKHTWKFYLHNIDWNESDTSTSFSFYIETENPSLQLTGDNVFVLLNNTKIYKQNLGIDGKKIKVELSKNELAGKKVLRVAVSSGGRTSNIQTIYLQDGKPADNHSDFLWQDAIIYSMMIDRFNDGDNTNSIPVQHPALTAKTNYMGGDLQGIINKIEEEYFSSLGVNTLWISPVIDNTDSAYQEYPAPHRYYTGYHGYWPVHPTKVEERFGDMELLKKMINIAHSKNLKVLLDYVANHIHIEHPFWKEHRDWFGNLELPDGRKNLRLWDEQRLTTWFEPFMPSFDFERSSEALNVMTDNAVWWLKETGADGFRHDAVKHIPNEFWRLLTKKIKKEFSGTGKDYLYQIGETFGSYELVSSYVNKGQLDAQFNFNLYDTAIPVFIDSAASFKSLDEQMKKTFSVYGVNHLMGNIMDSHDKVRFMAFADGDVAVADAMNAGETGWANPPEVDHKSSYEKLKLKTVYLQTIPGLPVVYYGDELGMTGAADPDNRRMMKFDNELKEIEKQTLNEVTKIINLRKEHPALRYGDFLTLQADENIYAYMRSDMNERIITILNKSSKEISTTVPLPNIYKLKQVTDLIQQKKIILSGNNLPVVLKPYSFMILKTE